MLIGPRLRAAAAAWPHRLRRLDELDPRLVDAAMAAAVGLPSAAVTVRLGGLPAVALVAMMTVPLAWRRCQPVAAYAVQTAGLVLAGAVEPPVARFVLCFLAVLGGAYSTGRYGTSWRASLGVVAASMVPGAVLAAEHGSPVNGLWFLQLLFAWAIGFSLRRQLGRIAAALPSRPVAPEPRPDPAAAVAAGLTRREMEVLRLVARGLSNREVAELLYISQGTVKTHVARILDKLGVRDRVQVVVRAHETGLVASGSHGADGPGGSGIRLEADGRSVSGQTRRDRAASSFQDVMEARHDPSAVWRRGR